jgi:hypothetical protein
MCYSINPYIGWKAKPQLAGQEDKVFMLDFFGSRALKGTGLALSPLRFLTAFPTPFNTFLGYYIDTNRLQIAQEEKMNKRNRIQGVLWGKDPRHFESKDSFVLSLAQHVSLVSTASSSAELPRHVNISYLGHQSSEQWLRLLAKSRFLLGLGHPLLGPSALDCVSLGCVFINPTYSKPMLDAEYRSQHPYIKEVSKDHVCEYAEGDWREAWKCVEEVLGKDRDALIPPNYTKEQYLLRVQRIFKL